MKILNIYSSDTDTSYAKLMALLSTLSLMAFAFFSSWHEGYGKVFYNTLLVFWILGGYYKISFKMIGEYRFFLFLALFVLLLAVGVSWSSDPWYGKTSFHRYSYLLLSLVILPIVNDKNKKHIAGALLGGILFTALNSNLLRVGLLESRNPEMIPAVNLIYHELSFYLSALILLLLNFATTAYKKKKYVSLLSGVLFLFFFFQMFGLKSRMPLIAAVLSIGFYCWIRYYHQQTNVSAKIFIALSLLAVLAWNSSPVARERFFQFSEDYANLEKGNFNSALGCRIAYADVGFAIVGEHPFFGIGTGGQKKAFNQKIASYKNGIYEDLPNWLKTYHFHNDYLEIMVQLGLIGLVVYLLMMCSLVCAIKASRFFPLAVSVLFIFWFSGLTNVMFVHRVIIYSLSVFIPLIIFDARRQIGAVGTVKKKRPMNILYISSKKRWGGVSSWMKKTAEALAQRGHRVFVVAHPKGRFAASSPGSLGTIPRKLGMDYNPAAVLFLIRLIRSRRIDLVVTNIEKEVIAGGIAARWCGIPNIRRVGREDDFNEKWKVKWHHHLLVDRCIVPCDRVRENAMKRATWLKADQFTTIYNGKNVREFSRGDVLRSRKQWGLTEDALVVGVTSQLSVQKGIDGLIRVFGRLAGSPQGHPVYLVIHGEGKERERLERMVRDQHLADRVMFAGFTADPIGAATAYDIAVSNSTFEGFPNSVVEYFAAGRPVVTTDAGGVTEMAVHEENALVVPVGDETLLQAAIERLIHDRTLRETLGRNARETIQQGFSEDHMIDRLEHFFQETAFSGVSP